MLFLCLEIKLLSLLIKRLVFLVLLKLLMLLCRLRLLSCLKLLCRLRLLSLLKLLCRLRLLSLLKLLCCLRLFSLLKQLSPHISKECSNKGLPFVCKSLPASCVLPIEVMVESLQVEDKL